MVTRKQGNRSHSLSGRPFTLRSHLKTRAATSGWGEMGSTRGRGRRSWSAPRVAAENSKTRPQATHLEGGEERSETAAEREQWKTQHKPTTGPGIKYPPRTRNKKPCYMRQKNRKIPGPFTALPRGCRVTVEGLMGREAPPLVQNTCSVCGAPINTFRIQVSEAWWH